jgi:hypothetical protein
VLPRIDLLLWIIKTYFLDELFKEFYGQPSVKSAVAGAALDGLLQDSTF